MLKIKLLIAALFTSMLVSASAPDIRDVLNSLGRSDSSSSSTKNSVSDILGAVNKLTGNTKVTLKDLTGSWKYSAPAVGFKSDNLLKNAGGIAASATVENKIKPYYEKAGLSQLTITFDSDSTFTINIKKIKITGTLSQAGSENFIFKFKALGKTQIGEMEAFINKETSNKISLTFDASKLISLVDKISKISGSSSLKAASSLLNSYDGMTLGFKLDRQ